MKTLILLSLLVACGGDKADESPTDVSRPDIVEVEDTRVSNDEVEATMQPGDEIVEDQTLPDIVMCDAIDLCGQRYLEITVEAPDGTVRARFEGEGLVRWPSGGATAIDCDEDGSADPEQYTCATADAPQSHVAQGTVNLVLPDADYNAPHADVELSAADGSTFDSDVTFEGDTRTVGSGACAQTCSYRRATVRLVAAR